ncbi:unnamed protein product [Effrenium voratum]|uniref:tRNA:m(4)X modification enzyme TRM13 n=1 Tax=Effrenium voratum TaxID=2562239 RepID=A0AA36HR98_9DINO|nr:unnamed protein product [Effrenium voratum]
MHFAILIPCPLCCCRWAWPEWYTKRRAQWAALPGMVDELLAAIRGYSAKWPPLQCDFVHSKKGKRCRLRAAAFCTRCKTHLDVGDRVQCPLDPSHTVERCHLERHLATACPSLRDAQFLRSQPFFRAGINRPPQRSSSLDVGSMDRDAWIARIEAVFPKAVCQALGWDPSSDVEPIVQQSLSEAAGEIGHSDKHGLQNQSLCQLASEVCGARLSEAIMVEYGCGRGALSLSLLQAHPEALSVLVDRDTRRHRVEQRREGHEVLRLRMDIADFDLGALLWEEVPDTDATSAAFARCARSAQRSRHLHVIADRLRTPPFPPRGGLLVCAKHLCGSGTDLALRSLRGTRRRPAPIEVGLCCATCCHHRCDLDTYVNPGFLSALGLTDQPQDFAEFVSAAGWAVGAVDTRLRRAGVMAKRILDYGRVAWLRRELGFADAKVVSYVSKEVTPENVAIVFNGISAGTEENALRRRKHSH